MAGTDKFPPGAGFGLPDPRRVASPVAAKPSSEAPPGLGFGLKPPAAPAPLPPAPPVAPTPTGPRPPVPISRLGDPDFVAGSNPPSPTDLRALTEGGLTAAAEFAGARFFGGPGAVAGAGLGAFSSSLLSNAFDPLESPIPAAIEAGLTAAAVSSAFAGGLVGVRKAIGDPNEAGKFLIRRAEKSGVLPPAGAIFSDSALLTNAQSIAQADIIFGHRVSEGLRAANGQLTDDLRQWLDSYLKFKHLGSATFSKVDSLIESTIGSKGVVQLPEHVWEATRNLTKGWKSLGLHKSDDMIASLVNKVDEAEARLASKAGVKFEPPLLSLREADALGDRFYEAARAADKGSVAQQQALAGVDYGRAYRQFAREVDDSFSNAVDEQIKAGALAVETKAELQGARTLWRRWKSGSVMRDHVMDVLDDAARQDGPLDSGSLFSAITRMKRDVDSTKVTPLQVKHLTQVARAMAQAEKSAGQKAFTWTVRAGQLGLLVGGPSILEGGARAVMFMTLTPSLLNWLTTSQVAVGWMVRGMHVQASTEVGLRLAEQLVTAAVRNGVFPSTPATRTRIEAESPEFRTQRNPLALPLPDVALPPIAPGFSMPQPQPQRNPAFPSINPSFPTGPSRPLRAPPLPAGPRG